MEMVLPLFPRGVVEIWKYHKNNGLKPKMWYFHASAQRGISTARGRTISTPLWKNPHRYRLIAPPASFPFSSGVSFILDQLLYTVPLHSLQPGLRSQRGSSST